MRAMRRGVLCQPYSTTRSSSSPAVMSGGRYRTRAPGKRATGNPHPGPLPEGEGEGKASPSHADSPPSYPSPIKGEGITRPERFLDSAALRSDRQHRCPHWFTPSYPSPIKGEGITWPERFLDSAALRSDRQHRCPHWFTPILSFPYRGGRDRPTPTPSLPSPR